MREQLTECFAFGLGFLRADVGKAPPAEWNDTSAGLSRQCLDPGIGGRASPHRTPMR